MARFAALVLSAPLARSRLVVLSGFVARSRGLVLSSSLARFTAMVLSAFVARSGSVVLSARLARFAALVLSRSLARSKLERRLDFMSMALVYHDVWCRRRHVKLMPIPYLVQVR